MTNMKLLIYLAFFVLPLYVFADTSVMPNSYLLTKNKVILTVAITDGGYFPYNYKEDGERKGLTIDVINYFKENSTYDFEFLTVPWPRALYLVAHGKIDLVLTLFKTPERENIYHFIEPSYGYEVNQLFTLADKNVEFNGQLQQLSPYSIGIIREYSYGENFDQANYLNKFSALTEEKLLKLLLSKRIDMVVSNPFIFNRIISKYDVTSQIRAIKPYISVTPVYIALSKGRNDSQEIKKILGQLIQKLKASLYYQELLDKYQLDIND